MHMLTKIKLDENIGPLEKLSEFGIFTELDLRPIQSAIHNICLSVCAFTENPPPGDFWSNTLLLILAYYHTILAFQPFQ